MKKTFFLFVLLLCCGRLTAQTVEGNVLDAASGIPVKNAILETPSQTIVSGENGEFVLPLKAFPVELKISAEGYKEKTLLLKKPQDRLTVYLVPQYESLAEVVLQSSIIPQKLLETPASVSLLDEEELQRFDETNISEGLDMAAGVNVQQGALNTSKLSIRGIGARSQYSTNRVKAYFMEIPLSTAEGETALEDIDPSVVSRAEIFKGPVSSVYGAGLGGVINLYPSEPDKTGLGGKVKIIRGSFELLKNTLQASYVDDNKQLLATYNGISRDGFRENSSYSRNSATVNGQVGLGENTRLGFLGQFTRLKAYIPSSLDFETFSEDPSAAAANWAAARGYESYDKGLLGLSLKHDFSEALNNTSSIFTNFRDAYEPRPFDILNEDRSAIGGRTKFNLKTRIFKREAEASLGAEVYREWYHITLFENLYEFREESLPGDMFSNTKENRSYYNIFGQLNLYLLENLKLQAGLNLNSTRYELDDIFTDDATDQSGNHTFDAILSPRAGLVYELTPNKDLYASVSHGFSTPTVAETLTPEGLINTNLKAETGINYEIGFKGNFFNKRLYAEFAAFTIQVDNLLVAERVGEDRYIGRNVGKTDHDGLELLLNYRFYAGPLRVNPFINAAYNRFRFDEFIDAGEDFSGNDLPAVPDTEVFAGLDLSTEFGFKLRASYQYKGQMALNDENSAYTSDYQLVHLKASFEREIIRNWRTEFFGGVKNLLDEHYAASIVPNAVAFGGASPRYYYPGDPRNYFAGVAVSYNF
ncbi:MAG: TonB-dependent receptor [Salinimicrobium sp.]